MTNNFPLGSTLTYVVLCRKKVGGSESSLFDPSSLKVSFLRPDGSEDTLTYGGSDPRDDDLVRLSVGVYEANYVLSVAGEWNVDAQAIEVIGDKSWPSQQIQPTRITVRESDGHRFADAPAAP